MKINYIPYSLVILFCVNTHIAADTQKTYGIGELNIVSMPRL